MNTICYKLIKFNNIFFKNITSCTDANCISSTATIGNYYHVVSIPNTSYIVTSK